MHLPSYQSIPPHFSERMRIQGWTQEHREYLWLLRWRHAIMHEELYGLSACTENVEYSLHMPDDIVRHSTLDNYWCFLYERQVRYYKHQTTNNKSLCKTYADRAQQLYFVNTYLQTVPLVMLPSTQLTTFQSHPFFCVQRQLRCGWTKTVYPHSWRATWRCSHML